MALPKPYDGVAGVSADPAESECANFHAQYRWIFRLADEMNGETQLNVKKAAQIVLHMLKGREWFLALDARRQREGASQDPDWPFTRPSGEILDKLRGYMASKNCAWPTRAAMATDLQTLAAECATLRDWIEANMADYKTGYSTNRIDANGNTTDDAILIAKPSAFATRIAAFRALFAA